MTQVVVLSALVFAIGVFGLLVRRDGAGLLVSLALMVNASGIALVGFARNGYDAGHPLNGMVLALLASVVGAAELALGVALLLLVQRRHGTTQVDDLDELRG